MSRLINRLLATSVTLWPRQEARNQRRTLTTAMEKLLDKPKVELHVHLDGAVTPQLLWDTAKRRGMTLSAGSVEELGKQISMPLEGTLTLTDFLGKFDIFLPVIAGDAIAIEEMAYEFCRTCREHNTIYAEARFAPGFLATGRDLDSRRVTQLVLRGLRRGNADFGVDVRGVLACIRTLPDWSAELLALCDEFRDEGIVGIDLAGDENLTKTEGGTQAVHVEIMQKAAEMGIHRTVHAGENGTAENVREAVKVMKAERVGHGYHVLDDPDLYRDLLTSGVHYEVCPYSSYTTTSVSGPFREHPLVRFAADGANFSINTDDPVICLPGLRDEYRFVLDNMGLTARDIAKANLNAAKSCFLPEKEKQELIATIEKAYAEELA